MFFHIIKYFTYLVVSTGHTLFTAMFVRRTINKLSKVDSLRRSETIHLAAGRTALHCKSIFVMAPKIYNKLSMCLGLVENVDLFRKKLCSFLIDKSYYSIYHFFKGHVSAIIFVTYWITFCINFILNILSNLILTKNTFVRQKLVDHRVITFIT